MNKSSLLTKGLINRYNVDKFYNIGQKLGVGTYSEVRAAECVTSKNPVAIKISRGKTACRMLENEAGLMQSLDYKCFPKFIEFNLDEVTNKAYLTMEKIEGDTVYSTIEEGKHYNETQIIKLILELTRMVKILHDMNICHRDIKPQNVMITSEGELKLLDFGISTLIAYNFTEDDEVKTMSKFYGRFFTQISSPLYAAPEIISNNCYNESVDIWGIGVIFLMLMQKSDIIESVNENFINISISSDVSEKTKAVLDKVLAAEPESRPSADELISMLEILQI
jgi:serine/threonine protein kinase